MKFTAAQIFLFLIFLVIIFGFSAVNLYTQGPAIWQVIEGLTPPSSFAEVKEDVDIIVSAINTNITRKTEFVDGYAYLQLLMGKDEIDNFNTVRGKNSAMNYANFYPEGTDHLREYAIRLRRLQDYAGESCPVLFLNPPAMHIRGVSEHSAGIPYYDMNATQDAFLYFLQSYGIDYIDARVTFADNSLEPEKYFFKTDHHWTIEASFETFIDVVKAFRSLYSVDLDPWDFYTDLNNYNKIIYPESFLGSLGKRSGAIFGGVDDFTLIWPKFESDYVWEANGSSGHDTKRGPYEHSLLYTRALRTDDPYNTILYSAYMSGIKSWTKIRNRLNPEGPKLLMIHDSYSVPLATFLAPLFSEIHMIWPLAEVAKTDIDEYVKENKFDHIIVQMYSGNINEKGMNFFVSPLEGE
jgi:hypothetical protein